MREGCGWLVGWRGVAEGVVGGIYSSLLPPIAALFLDAFWS